MLKGNGDSSCQIDMNSPKPSLQDCRETREVKLPSVPKSKIDNQQVHMPSHSTPQSCQYIPFRCKDKMWPFKSTAFSKRNFQERLPFLYIYRSSLGVFLPSSHDISKWYANFRTRLKTWKISKLQKLLLTSAGVWSAGLMNILVALELRTWSQLHRSRLVVPVSFTLDDHACHYAWLAMAHK